MPFWIIFVYERNISKHSTGYDRTPSKCATFRLHINFIFVSRKVKYTDVFVLLYPYLYPEKCIRLTPRRNHGYINLTPTLLTSFSYEYLPFAILLRSLA